MAIKRYTAYADNTITNQYDHGLSRRKTGANAGQADSLEIFKIYGQATSTSVEQSRVLIRFPINDTTLTDITTIKEDRTSGVLPAKDSVSFYLKLSDVRHADTVPPNFKLVAHPLTKDWDEGYGIDLDEYSDAGQSSWLSASTSVAWAAAGSDYNASLAYEQTFDTGFEDLAIDVTAYVEGIIDESITSGDNFGLVVMLSSSYISDTNSYYTKKFSARSSEYFFQRPVIEARWDSSIKDQRRDFYYSSSIAAAGDNLNTIYMYTNIGGRLKNLPDVATGNIYVNLYQSSASAPDGSPLTVVVDALGEATTVVTGGYVSTGVYSASFACTGTATTLHDVWYKGSTQYHTGTLYPETRSLEQTTRTNDYYVSITNLREKYSNEETARFRIYTRLKGWSPTIYTRAVSEPQLYIPTSGSYEIIRIVDNYKVVAHATGSTKFTELSYDGSGSYFDFDMSMLDPGYLYGIKLAFYDDFVKSYKPTKEIFRFRVEKYET